MVFTAALAEETAALEPAWHAGITEWATAAFRKVAEISPMAWGVILVLILAALALLVLARQRLKWDARMIAVAALCVALSFILSCIRLYRMPRGGSITPASMLPLIAFSYLYGVGPGLAAGMANGMLQFLQDPFVVHPVQFLLDYPFAFGALCLAGLFRKKSGPVALPAGVLVAGLARFACSVVSGAVFFAEYAGPQNPWLYSIIYNGSYMLPDTVVCAVLACVPALQATLRRITGMKHLSQ